MRYRLHQVHPSLKFHVGVGRIKAVSCGVSCDGLTVHEVTRVEDSSPHEYRSGRERASGKVGVCGSHERGWFQYTVTEAECGQ